MESWQPERWAAYHGARARQTQHGWEGYTPLSQIHAIWNILYNAANDANPSSDSEGEAWGDNDQDPRFDGDLWSHEMIFGALVKRMRLVFGGILGAGYWMPHRPYNQGGSLWPANGAAAFFN